MTDDGSPDRVGGQARGSVADPPRRPWHLPARRSVTTAITTLVLLLVPATVATVWAGTDAGLVVGLCGGIAMAFGAVMPVRQAAFFVVVVGAVAGAAAAADGDPVAAALVVAGSTLLVAVANAVSVGAMALTPVLAVVLATSDRELTWWQAAGWAVTGCVIGVAAVRVVHGRTTARPMERPNAWRHAVVLALAAGTTLLVALNVNVTHGYWVTVTILVALRPIAGERRLVLRDRLWGTIVGALAALLIVALLPGWVAIASAWLFMLALTAYAIEGNQFMQTVFLTPMLLLFAAAGDETITVELTIQRVLFTLAGVAISAALIVLLARWDQWSDAQANSR